MYSDAAKAQRFCLSNLVSNVFTIARQVKYHEQCAELNCTEIFKAYSRTEFALAFDWRELTRYVLIRSIFFWNLPRRHMIVPIQLIASNLRTANFIPVLWHHRIVAILCEIELI